MTKRRIFWFLQQVKNMGGTEVVTIQIINMLSDVYDITLVVLSEKPEVIPYNLNKNVKVKFLGINQEETQLDRYFGKHIDNKEYLKAIKLAAKTNDLYFYSNFKVKKQILSFTTKDDILVISSQELMLFMPNNRFVYRHFHYNSYLYHKAFNKMLMLYSRKPDFTIFLSKSTKEALKYSDKKSTYIYNPARYPSELHTDFHNNSLLFVGRFEAQKNPLFLLKALKELNKTYTNYTMTIVGNGSLICKMNSFIAKNKLQNIKIVTDCTNPIKYYQNSDLLLMTSRYEGFPLCALEAQSQSCPVLFLDIKDPTKDLIIEGQNGSVVYKKDPKVYAERLKSLLENKDELIKMKEKSYEYSLRYQPSKIKEDWINLFDSHDERLK